MAMMSRTRDLLMEGLEGLVREGSFKWGLPRREDADGDEDNDGSLPGRRSSIPSLSFKANSVVARCSRILDVSLDDLQNDFDKQASDSVKNPRNYARNFLEYCCFMALAQTSQVAGYLADKSFRRLSFDMMIAWDVPSSSQHSVKVEVDSTVSLEAFTRIAPAIPTIADVVTCSNLFDVLSSSSGGRLPFSVYEKYLSELDRAVKKMKSQSESSLLSNLRSQRGERILEVDGTLTTQPVLEHVGISTWPGRLILTDHALYFEALRVVTYDKPKAYELAEDVKQVVKPELTGPWGSRLFDKAVMYKSTTLLFVGEMVVGEISSLQKAVIDSMNNYKKVELAQATVDGVKVEGLDTNLAVMKELLSPVSELWRILLLLTSWDEPLKSMAFCLVFSYIIIRGWVVYFMVMVLLFSAAFMFLTRLTNQGKPMTEVKVVSPPPMNTMEQLLAVQNAISKIEELVQDANIVLLKIRALLLAFPSQ
nr:unnamed protein product [Digitaria exilis]